MLLGSRLSDVMLEAWEARALRCAAQTSVRPAATVSRCVRKTPLAAAQDPLSVAANAGAGSAPAAGRFELVHMGGSLGPEVRARAAR